MLVNIFPDAIIAQSGPVDYHAAWFSDLLEGINALPEVAEAERSGFGYKDHKIGCGYSLDKRA